MCRQKWADAIANRYQVEIASVLTGFRFIAERIHETSKAGNKQFLFGFEESFGYLAGNFVKDKDAVCASMLLCEAATYYALQDKTLLNALELLYLEYGYYKEDALAYTLTGIEGHEKIAAAMAALRQEPLTEIAGVCVEATLDYLKGTRTQDGKTAPADLPQSNVIYYELEDCCWAAVRPSGTEPKLKAYIGTRGKSGEDCAKRLQAVKQSLKSKLDAALHQ